MGGSPSAHHTRCAAEISDDRRIGRGTPALPVSMRAPRGGKPGTVRLSQGPLGRPSARAFPLLRHVDRGRFIGEGTMTSGIAVGLAAVLACAGCAGGAPIADEGAEPENTG